MNTNVSIKELVSQMIYSACESTEIKLIVQSLELLNQELLKDLPDNNRSRGKFVGRMIKHFSTKYLGI